MRVSISEQIHRSLVADEEARCKALEAFKGKPVKRTEIPPWTRRTPECLTQDPELLARITEYSYDLDDRSFRKYCAARGVLHVAGQRGSLRWRYMSDTRRGRDRFLSASAFQYAQEHNGERYKYTDAEMATAWRILQLGRAALEDAWDLYRRGRPRGRLGTLAKRGAKIAEERPSPTRPRRARAGSAPT
jgi:hypothetical protein